MGRVLVAFVLAWAVAHFLTLGSSGWGPGNRHDAMIFGQMIAVAAFPIMGLLAFGAWKRLTGPVIVACVACLAGLATLIHL
ncbi:hypothetical protein GOB81_10560 [Acetobacter sp. LMG 1627]|uniref:Iron uptake protein n=1 Tax=Acetobacter conturbans TaxID=1737472 RepID=A0ABX0K026_9PROT|nr:hypothetical protein [Acetobacter conturbans]